MFPYEQRTCVTNSNTIAWQVIENSWIEGKRTGKQSPIQAGYKGNTVQAGSVTLTGKFYIFSLQFSFMIFLHSEMKIMLALLASKKEPEVGEDRECSAQAKREAHSFYWCAVSVLMAAKIYSKHWLTQLQNDTVQYSTRLRAVRRYLHLDTFPAL